METILYNFHTYYILQSIHCL